MVAEKYPLKKEKRNISTISGLFLNETMYIDLDTTMFFKSVEIQMDCINSWKNDI